MMIRLYYVLSVGIVFVLLTSLAPNQSRFTDNKRSWFVADSIIAFVYRGGTQNPGLSCSTKSTGDPVQGLKVTLRDYDSGQVLDDDITDANGQFELLAPSVGTYISLEPCKKDYLPGGGEPAYNGITVADVNILRYHIRKETALNCPMLRVAGDFQFDGKLDSADISYLNSFVQGQNSQKYPYNPWRLLPNILNFPTRLHPDLDFTTDYWTLSYPVLGDPGALYPFEASLNLLGEQIDYRTSIHWRDTVDRWEYTPAISACGVADYGFWLVKAGDLDGSATIDIFDNCIGGTGGGGGGSGNLISNNSGSNEKQGLGINQLFVTPSLVNGDLSSFDEGEYWLHVTLNAQQPIEAYQMGLQLDTSWLDILEIDPIDDLEQSLDLHYNDKPSELSQGRLRTVWLDNETTGNIASQTWRKVVQLKVLLKKNIQIPEDLLNTVSLDEDLMKAEFISNYVILEANQVEVKFEFEAL